VLLGLYRGLLAFFFQIHDPTTLNRQGNEVGRSVRSTIFFTSEEQGSPPSTLLPTSMHPACGLERLTMTVVGEW
jgi:peptide methionine sulfoxide reductase MsrA